MSFESTPGVSVRPIRHPKREEVKPHTEYIFVFDLSKMTLATAFADPRLSDDPISQWSVDQLFRVMLEPKDPAVVKEIEELRPMFLRHLVGAITGNPLNDEVVPLAARHDPKSGSITAFRSTYSTAEEPDRVRNTVLHVSADATRYEFTAGVLPDIRDDLLQPRVPSGGFISYLKEFRSLRLKPLQRLIAKNDADVRKVLTAMACVQQINLALSFAEDFSLHDRSKVWSDFFDQVKPSGIRYFDMTQKELEQLFLHGDDFADETLDHVQIAKLRDFRKKQVDPLIDQLGKAAAWARAAETHGVKVCASAKKRDAEAKRLLKLLRMDDTILDALDQWDDVAPPERVALSWLFDDLLAAFSRCPGAMESLLESELVAVARGAAGAAASIPTLPQGSPRQKAMSAAIAGFDPKAALGSETPTTLTKVINRAFERYATTRTIASPIVSLWAHSTPAILARFDKLTPDRVNSEGTAYLFRSVFGMGLLTTTEMKELYSDLDGIVESAAIKGVSHKQTRARLKDLFKKDLSHGKYPLRSRWWGEGKIFNSMKLAVGLLGIRQGFIAAADDKTLSPEGFIDLSAAVLRATEAADELRPLLKDIFGAGKSAVHHAPSFLDQLPSAGKLARVTALVSLVSSYQAVGKTDASSLARDHAHADLAVAWLSLMVVLYETALATTFPVAGLALILLRWVLFDQDLWDLIGGVTSASPAVKVVRGILETIEDEGGEMGAFLRLAPNWGVIQSRIEDVRDQSPATVETSEVAKYGTYFHLQTGHDGIVRTYAARSYGIAEEVAELIVEG